MVAWREWEHEDGENGQILYMLYYFGGRTNMICIELNITCEAERKDDSHVFTG